MFVVPTLQSTFESLDAELPKSTQMIVAASNFMQEYTLLFIGLLLAAVGGFISGLRTYPGKRAFEWFILHLPMIKTLVQETNSARTARTFASLLSSGVEIVSAISITKDVVQNTHYKDVLAQAEERIQKGEPLAQVFIENDHLYPVLFGEIILVGEETGKLSLMLEQIATFYEDEVSQKTKDMSTIIEPFLMLIIGGVVGFFAISMISPIYSVGQNF